MKKIFLKDDRLREILTDRNKKIELLLLTKKLRGSLRIKLTTKGIHFGWEIIDLEDGPEIEERLGETTQIMKPIGSFVETKDLFHPVKNIGVFPKGK